MTVLTVLLLLVSLVWLSQRLAKRAMSGGFTFSGENKVDLRSISMLLMVIVVLVWIGTPGGWWAFLLWIPLAFAFAAISVLLTTDFPPTNWGDLVDRQLWGTSAAPHRRGVKAQMMIGGALVTLTLIGWGFSAAVDSFHAQRPPMVPETTAPATLAPPSPSVSPTTSGAPALANCGVPTLEKILREKQKLSTIYRANPGASAETLSKAPQRCVEGTWTNWPGDSLQVTILEMASDSSYSYYRFQLNGEWVLIRAPQP